MSAALENILRTQTAVLLIATLLVFTQVSEARMQWSLEGKVDLPYTEQDLAGTFVSQGCENIRLTTGDDISHLRRYYNWTVNSYATTYAFFEDASCARPTFTFFFAGPYQLGRARTELGKVREIHVLFDVVTMKAESDVGARMLQESKCGSFVWKAGMTMDVGDHTCLIKQPRASCLGDNELLMLDGDRLAPGVRPQNMCEPEGRPRSIQRGTLVKRVR